MQDFEADLFSALVVFGEGILYSPYRLPFPARKTLYNLTIFRKKAASKAFGCRFLIHICENRNMPPSSGIACTIGSVCHLLNHSNQKSNYSLMRILDKSPSIAPRITDSM